MDLLLILLFVNSIRNSIGAYILFPEQVNFTQAVQICSSINAKVVFIDNSTEDTYIKNTYLPLVKTAIWLAIYDIIGNETNVNYYTNRTLNYTNWVYDNRNDKCFRYEKNKQWLDIICGSLYSTLCEFSTVQTGFTVTNVTAAITTISVSNIMNIPLWNTWNPWSFCEFRRQRNNKNMSNGIENEILNVSCSLVCEH
jgi:hypothetical protein